MQSRSAAGTGLATETLLAEVLAVILRVDNVPVDSNFFTDLGADSLVMAQFCARVRKRNGLPPVTIKDVYQHPTIAALSAALVPAPAAHTNRVSGQLAEILAAVLKVATVPARQPLLRRSGRRLAADGAILRQGAEELRPAAGDHEGRLPASHDHRAERRRGPRRRRAAETHGPATRRNRGTGRATADRPVRICTGVDLSCLLLLRGIRHGPGLRLDFRGVRADRHLSAVGVVRRRAVRGRLPVARCRQMAAGRSLETTADPAVESAIRPILDREDVDPGQPVGLLRGFAAVRAVPALAGREDRPRSGDSVQDRSGVHRSVDHRLRNGHPQGVLLPGLPGTRRTDPDRPRHHRP